MTMKFKNQLQNDLQDAMRARDDLRKRTLRMALTAIQLAEVDKGEDLEDADVLAILQKEVKTRQETIQEAKQAGRPELEADTLAEVQVLEVYLPKQLSQEELEALAQEAIQEVGATEMRQMGQVMKVLMPRLGGRATGEQASQAVRKLLA